MLCRPIFLPGLPFLADASLPSVHVCYRVWTSTVCKDLLLAWEVSSLRRCMRRLKCQPNQGCNLVLPGGGSCIARPQGLLRSHRLKDAVVTLEQLSSPSPLLHLAAEHQCFGCWHNASLQVEVHHNSCV